MTIRFAAAHAADSTALLRALTVVSLGTAANDNTPLFPRDNVLRAALRHFAEHGLGAAELAYRNAQQAFFAGDRQQYRHWLAICRALDRRMADTIGAKTGHVG